MLEVALFGSPDGSGTRWRLLGANDDIARSRNYVRLKFDVIGGQLNGTLIAWHTEEEVPLVDVRFDGVRLSLRLPSADTIRGPQPAAAGSARVGSVAARTARLSLTLSRDREFRGFYVDDLNRRLDPDHELKLVKVDDEVASL